MDTPGKLAAHFFREHSGKMVADLVRVYGLAQLDNILDAVQDTFETALSHWRYHGIPANPPAWLSRVAHNNLINLLKRANRSSVYDNGTLLAKYDTDTDDAVVDDPAATDSQLSLLMACCHEALTERDRMLITLHVLSGFGVPELANALQLPPETVKKALQRSKAKLRAKDIHFGSQPTHKLTEQSATVCHILYLMFNEGYKTTRSKSGMDTDLCYEAMRLSKLMLHLAAVPEEVHALLALMFFSVARFPARSTAYGCWIPLEEQDRTCWNKQLIAEGLHHLDTTKHGGYAGKYYLEALIASHHCTAPDFEKTDWASILALYRLLEGSEPPSTLIRLNRLIAESYTNGPLAVIAELETIPPNGTTGERYLLANVKAHVYHHAGIMARARAAYETALSLAPTPRDRQFIQKRMTTL